MASIQQQLERAEEIIDYRFRNRAHLDEALLLPGPGSVPDGNKRLAVVGDAAMAPVLARSWYLGGQPLGHWDTMRKNSLGNTNLAIVAFETGLAECRTGNNSQATFSGKQAATLLEAVVGAVYMDSDGDVTTIRRVMRTLGLGDMVKSFLISSINLKAGSMSVIGTSTCGASNKGDPG